LALGASIVAGRPVEPDDARWIASGAHDRDQFLRYAPIACGMACLQMVLAAHERFVPPVVELVRKSLTYGCYVPRQGGGLDGMYYAAFVRFVAAEFGLRATVHSPLTVSQLRDRVRSDQFVMASVSKEIRDWPATPSKRGGHLVLVFAAGAGALTFHNPSGHPSRRSACDMPDADFVSYFAQRGIAIEAPTAVNARSATEPQPD
jgi:hypothetical protein